MRKMNLADSLKWSSITYPDKIALVYEGGKSTYSELNSTVNRLSNAILRMGFKKGDKLSVLLFNCKEYIEILLSLTKIGVIPIPLNFRYIGKEIEYIINHSESKGLILGEEFIETVKPVLPHLNIPLEKMMVVGKQIPEGMKRYENMLAQSTEKEPDTEAEPTDCFWIQYTAGTTGFPKGCIHLQETIMECVKIELLEHGISREDINLTSGPIFHTAPGMFVFTQLAATGTIYVMNHFKPDEALKIIESQKITNAFMVPSMLDAIVNLPEDEKMKYDLRSMRVLVSGGSPLHTNTKEGLIRLFKNAGLHEFYAGTEIGLTANLTPKDQLRKIRCVGKPVWGQEVKILDDDGNEVPRGDIGTIYMKGLIMSEGYYKDPQATLECRKGEWVTLDDMGRLDEEGYLYIIDRKKDMVISGGENIYPIEIEAVLLTHPKIREVAVIGVPDDKWGEVLKAIVVLKKGEEATEKEMIDFCGERLSGIKKPRSVEFRSELPRSSFGKVLKRVLREPYWKDREVKV